MISVAILDNGEPNVIQLTFENLYEEIKDIYGAELLVKDAWFDLSDIKNRYVCFVEPDCLVEKGYFKSQMEKFKEKGYSRNMGIMAASTAVCYWDNKIYGYSVGKTIQGILPVLKPSSRIPHTVEIAYIPGAIIRVSMLKTILEEMKAINYENMVKLSVDLSMAFWRKSAASDGKGYRVYMNPRTSYLTTEDYVNGISNHDANMSTEILNLFAKESI